MGKRAFSAKAKREQLRTKRAAAANPLVNRSNHSDIRKSPSRSTPASALSSNATSSSSQLSALPSNSSNNNTKNARPPVLKPSSDVTENLVASVSPSGNGASLSFQASFNPKSLKRNAKSRTSTAFAKPTRERTNESRAERYCLKFAADSEEARTAARALAHEPIEPLLLPRAATAVKEAQISTPSADPDNAAVDTGASLTFHVGQAHVEKAQEDSTRTSVHSLAVRIRELGPDDVRPPSLPQSAGPRRPPWRYGEPVIELEKRERAAFQEWLESVERDSLDAAFFEQNLETWRQLWRVIERSDVLILVADIRYPALHFVPQLYEHVSRDLGKGVVLALNKCDLVSAHLLAAWKEFFQKTYPGLAVALFSSFPDAKLAPDAEANSDLLSKREKRMARSTLAAWGADQLVAAIDSLPLPPHKKRYLEQWHSRLNNMETMLEDIHLGCSRDKLGSAGNEFHKFPGSGNEKDASKDSHANSELTVEGAESEDNDHVLDVNGILTNITKTDLEVPVNLCASSEQNEQICYTVNEDECHLGSMMTLRNCSDGVSRSDMVQSADQFLQTETGHKGNEDCTLDEMITIGVIGHPNAGKSSLINGIFGRKVVSTSSTPGHTKHLQTMFLSSHVRLCDCPGLVFPGRVARELQVIAGMYPIAQLREPYAVIRYLAERVPIVSILGLEIEIPKLEKENGQQILEHGCWTAWKICEAWAMKRGFRTAKAARLDVYRAANNILRLALDGRIVLATTPPGYWAARENDAEWTGSREYGTETVISAAHVFSSAQEPQSDVEGNDDDDASVDSENEYTSSLSTLVEAGHADFPGPVGHPGGMFGILGEV